MCSELKVYFTLEKTVNNNNIPLLLFSFSVDHRAAFSSIFDIVRAFLFLPLRRYKQHHNKIKTSVAARPPLAALPFQTKSALSFLILPHFLTPWAKRAKCGGEIYVANIAMTATIYPRFFPFCTRKDCLKYKMSEKRLQEARKNKGNSSKICFR